MNSEEIAVDVAAELRAELVELAEALDRLRPEDWDRNSLCEGWRVRDVVAHMTMPARRSAPNVMFHLLAAGFRFHSMADRLARRDAELPAGDLIADVRSERLQRWRPPGGGAEGALVHAVVHGLDVTVPLGIGRRLPPQRMRTVLDALTARRSLVHFGIDISGKEFRVDDLKWSWGCGDVVRADAQTMVLALSGRRQLLQPGSYDADDAQAASARARHLAGGDRRSI